MMRSKEKEKKLVFPLILLLLSCLCLSIENKYLEISGNVFLVILALFYMESFLAYLIAVPFIIRGRLKTKKINGIKN